MTPPLQPFSAVPRSPSAAWQPAAATSSPKSNWQLLEEVTTLPAERDVGVWKRLSSGDGTKHTFVVLRHEGLQRDAVSVWLVNTQEEAEHIAQYGGRGFKQHFKDVRSSLADAKAYALACAERSLAQKLKRKREDDAAAAAEALAASAPGAGAGVGAGMAPSGEDGAALQAQLGDALARVHQHAAQVSEANARLAQLEQRSVAQAAELADERRDIETLRTLLEDEQRDNATLRSLLALHQAALKTVRAACDGVADSNVGGANGNQ